MRLALVAALVTSACNQKIEQVEPRTADSENPAPPATQAGAPDVPWSRKTHDQRAEYMGLVVYPKMKAVFQSHDPKGYAEFRCQTCHGEDMDKVKFQMPHALYALPAIDTVKAASEYDEKTTKFMLEEVVPAMREMLGKDDPGTAGGFGCLSCHLTEK